MVYSDLLNVEFSLKVNIQGSVLLGSIKGSVPQVVTLVQASGGNFSGSGSQARVSSGAVHKLIFTDGHQLVAILVRLGFWQ